MGVTTDEDENVYIVVADDENIVPGENGSAYILKYGPGPDFDYIATSEIDIEEEGVGYHWASGIVYSETQKVLYVSTQSAIDDCVSMFDLDLNYLASAVPSPGTGDNGKGIAIIKECCPTAPNQVVNITECSTQLTEALFLNEVFPCDGTICEGQWMPVDVVSMAVYNDCNQSILAGTTTGCYTFVRSSDGTGSNAQCGAFVQTLNLTIGNAVEATASSIQPSCNSDGTIDSDGYLQITSITGGSNVRANWSVGDTYTGDPDYANAFDLSGATFPFIFPNATNLTNPIGSQDYTIRIFDGAGCMSGDCFTDIVVTMQEQDCTIGCECNEFIYLNEPQISSVLKFQVGSDVLLTELNQANGGTAPQEHWYPGTSVSELPNPHGLAVDLNGNLYIGSDISGGQIRQFRCDGTIQPVDGATINNTQILTNIFSIDNTLYSTTRGGVASYDICSGDPIGTGCYNDINGNPLPSTGGTFIRNWGLSYNATTEMVYATGMVTPYQGIWVFTPAELDAAIAGTNCIDPFIWRDATTNFNTIAIGASFLPSDIDRLSGIAADNDGNIYVVGWLLSPNQNQSVVLKYSPSGGLLAKSGLNSNYILSRGLVWSETNNRIYIANETDDPTVDCISAFDAGDLSYLGTAAPNPNLPGNNQAKALGIIKECCPTSSNQSIDIAACNPEANRPIFLNEQFPCEGTICEGMTWTPVDATSAAVYDNCSQAISATMPGCYTFTRSSDGTGANAQCGAFVQTLTISINEVVASLLGDDQLICSGADPEPFTITTAATGSDNLSFQWYVSSVSPTEGFVPIVGATSESYNPESTDVTADTMYFYSEVFVTGCTGERCSDTSNVVLIVTVPDVIVDAGEDVAVCRTAIVDLSSASIVPDDLRAMNSTLLGATWSSPTAGTFLDASGNALAFPARLDEVRGYQLSAADIAAGSVVLTLVSDDLSAAPFNVLGCSPSMDEVTITILQVDCGTFPWGGD